MRNYQAAIDYLFSFQRYGIKLGLENTHKLLETLGKPQDRLKFVHVAGTNGKGTTSKMIESILASSDYRAGCFTSPHLVRYNERISINGKVIPDRSLINLIARLEKAVARLMRHPGNNHPTYFEASLALALLYFADQKVDLVVLEVGMGGRFDATNVITPLVSAITNVSLDHSEYLGETLTQIAGEKAGIIKHNVPVFTTAKHPQVLDVIRAEAKAQNVYIDELSPAKDIEVVRSDLCYSVVNMMVNGEQIAGLRIAIGGDYQTENALLAASIVEYLSRERGFCRYAEGALRQAMSTLKWPGRMQKIASSPTVVLDGAHNPDAAERLVSQLRRHRKKFDKIHLIIAILADKDVTHVLRPLLALADKIVISSVLFERRMPPTELLQLARQITPSKEMDIYAPVGFAIEEYLPRCAPNDLVLICGSLYTVGEALSYFQAHPPPSIPTAPAV